MMLKALRPQRYALALAAPFATARQTLTVREGYLVWAQDAVGRWGVGECAPLPGFGEHTLAQCGAALQRLAEQLPQGEAPALDPERGLLLSGQPELPAAVLHGLEGALLDLAAQAAGVPLHRLLAGIIGAPLRRDPPAAVPVNATIGALPAAEAASRALQLVQQGFRTLKIKVGTGSVAQDVRRLAAVRAAVGDKVRLRADANGAWDLATARAALRQLAALGLEYVEQPLAAGDVADWAQLARESAPPLAADESVLSESAALQILSDRAAAVLVLKPMALGGLLPAARIAALAWRHGVRVVVTTLLEGAIGRAGALHLAAALSALAPPGLELPDCGLATGDLLREDLAPAPPPVHGRLLVPVGPGLGVVPFHVPGSAEGADAIRILSGAH